MDGPCGYCYMGEVKRNMDKWIVDNNKVEKVKIFELSVE